MNETNTQSAAIARQREAVADAAMAYIKAQTSLNELMSAHQTLLNEATSAYFVLHAAFRDLNALTKQETDNG